MNQQISVDPSQTTEVVCSNCNNDVFIQALKMRKISAILSPTGEESYIPVPVFACKACGNINEEFLPKEG
ncbi:hypothetical protein OAA15_00485 [bacterium]|nr:hypothetical protein [bacterium]